MREINDFIVTSSPDSFVVLVLCPVTSYVGNFIVHIWLSMYYKNYQLLNTLNNYFVE